MKIYAIHSGRVAGGASWRLTGRHLHLRAVQVWRLDASGSLEPETTDAGFMPARSAPRPCGDSPWRLMSPGLPATARSRRGWCPSGMLRNRRHGALRLEVAVRADATPAGVAAASASALRGRTRRGLDIFELVEA